LFLFLNINNQQQKIKGMGGKGAILSNLCIAKKYHHHHQLIKSFSW